MAVPPGATTGVITITSPAGTSTTSSNFLLYPAAPGTPPDWVWAKKQGELNSDYNPGLDMTTDSAGNNYVTGYFTGTAAFGDTTLTSNTSTAAMFLAKYSNTGKLIWARKIGDREAAAFGDFQGVLLTIDSQGNCYIAGEYRGNVFIGNPAARSVVFINSYNTSGTSDSYIAKFDASGQFVWAKDLGKGSSYETPTAINADKNGNVYVAGQYYGTSNSTAFIAGQSLPTSNYGKPYIVKYNTLGQTLWSKVGVQNGSNIQADKITDFYLAGESSITKYNANGEALSTVRMIGLNRISNGEEIKGMSIDAFGNKYITGKYADTITIGTSKLRSNGGTDIFIAKYDSSNKLIWVQTCGGQLNDRSTGIITDAVGNSYITGTFNGSAIFGPDTLNSNGDNDVFIAKYDRYGQLLWVQKGGGEINDLVYDIGIDANENSYIAGTFNTAAQFTDISVNSTQTNIFIAKLGSNVNTSKTGIVSICPGGDATLKADTTGNNYQWQVNTTQGYINVEDDSTYTGSNSRNLQLNKISGKISGTEYRCLVDGYISNPVQLKISDFWNGYINNAWENSFNWSCSGKVPDANTDVIINSGNVILNSNTIVKSVTIGQGATLTVKPGYKLTVTGK